MIDAELPYCEQVVRRDSTIVPELLTSGYRCVYVSQRAANLKVWRVLGSGTFRSADGVEVSSFERLGLKRHRGARTKKARPLVWKSSGRAIQARFYAELTLLN